MPWYTGLLIVSGPCFSLATGSNDSLAGTTIIEIGVLTVIPAVYLGLITISSVALLLQLLPHPLFDLRFFFGPQRK